MAIEVRYSFVSQDDSSRLKYQSDVVSYAGRLLEIVGSRTLIVGVDNNDVPFVQACNGRLHDALDSDW